ncbi:hypothetical protein BDV38DRAFT_21574 [Aspergillus pseudotamarii]|uniref:MIT domain-containing protein n=1 Tax=Aspergillus pseudotamarii TaxID=132259 RepID=A0A5N6S9N2_ASPPS|nr:uncharacterized protein BDV38DRAFT_21574 [Aspergillus pseudotamarii]KAE8131418.1 hypothetical protein BDV38DRAFT_21574 [Aspergillus pseudotamarii]
MAHNLTSEGYGRPMSPEYASIADTSAPRLSRANSWNRFKKKGSDSTELASRFGAVTPTRPELVSESVTRSPSTSPGDHIQEGLGSLNRWSQSTSSSKDSPKYDSYPQGVPSKASVDHDYTSPKGRASPERNTIPRLSPRVAAPTNDESPMQGHHSSHSVATGHYMRVLELGSHGTLSASPTNAIDPASSHQDHLPLGSTSIAASLFQNPWSRSSADAQAPNENSQMFNGREQIQGKRRRGHSQKAMLSKALQKANTAVLLDNAANFEGAMEAYNDACQLLQLVMLRSSGGEEEKSKLQEIRDTYMIRVTELQRMDFSFTEPNSKALPERPLSQESYSEMFQSIEDDDNEASLHESVNSLRRISDDHQPVLNEAKILASNRVPVRRQSLLPSAMDDDLRCLTLSPTTKQNGFTQTESFTTSRDEHPEMAMHFGSGQTSRTLNLDDDSAHHIQYNDWALLSTHVKDAYESTSWLDTIDESGASSPASTRSKVSSVYLRHGGSHHFSHGTEAEFDAALDAAVEAAYDEGFEPVTELNEQYNGGIDNNDDIVANARRNIELAKQKVREAEREAQVAMARGREVRNLQQSYIVDHSHGADPDYLDEEAEEEERLLEEMTRGYIMDDFNLDLQSKSALPRQSDSSSFSGRAWESLAISNTTTPGAMLSPLAEDSALPEVSAMAKQATEPLPTQANAVLPKSNPVPTPGPSVRARRMSGQRTTELKIETKPRLGADLDISSQSQSSEPAALPPPPPLPKDEPSTNFLMQTSKTLGPTPVLRSGVRLNKRNASIGSFSENTWTNASLDKPTIKEEDNNLEVSRMPSPARPIGKVPSAPDNLGKLNSSSKSFRARNVSVPGPDTLIDSPDTPSSAFPPFDIQKGAGIAAGPVLPTPTGTTFAPNGLPSGGLYLFDSNIHSPTNLGSPNATATNAPAPLEHCPESFLLRPFWLMRCIYQTIAHPSGGYLTTKLFVPRDVWRVKNVKIKALEEKVSNCDLLTAALLKLAKVDTYDADAVLEQMQCFETVLDQVQSSLSKKLGGEVGVQGAMALFKASQSSDDAAAVDTLPSKTSGGASKSYLTSWRKLRSKNSGFGGTTSQSNVKETSRDNLIINSLPMSSTPNSQPVKRNTTQLQFNGPNANYMSALARLCDAAQVLDQIAQQVEDPGLKHSSPTLVGLELSTRHAAEFFGFYICRFALNDIAMMVDKFIKRGSEWVLI